MIAVVCVALSAAGFYLSSSIEAFWPLAWVTPAPVLWFSFTRSERLVSFLCAALAHMLGGGYLVQAYVGLFPPAVLALALVAPALCFALAVVGAAFASRWLGLWAGVFAFASIWTALDYGLSLGPDGAAISPAYSQVAAPLLIQSSALFGLWGVTFALGFVSSGLAVALAYRSVAMFAAAAALFCTNAGYGAWRLSAALTGPEVQVGLVADDRLVEAAFGEGRPAVDEVLQRYAEISRDLVRHGARIIVWPEKTAVLASTWRGPALARLQALADETNATLIAGFDERADGRHNRAYVFSPQSNAPTFYDKRHLVQGLESQFSAGESSFQFAAGYGVAICKDMDFPLTLRADANASRLVIVFVPAWDFGRDAWWHARMATLRGVENGFSVARAAKEGLLMLSDAYGRQIRRARTSSTSAVTVVGALPAGSGATFYTRVGDLFAWLCIAMSGLLTASAAVRRRRQVGHRSAAAG